jgi:NADH-quinone oxidoreductase E subunit
MQQKKAPAYDSIEPRRENILLMLHEAQRARSSHNYITDEDLAGIAEKLDIPLAEAEGVLSFYRSFSRTPRGRYIIRVCDSLSCRIKGSLDVYHHLRARLGIKPGETTADGMYSLEVVNCLGSCDTAPNMMVNDTLHTHLDAERIDEILEACKQEVSA